MASESLFLRSIIPTLPTEIAGRIRSLCTSTQNEVMLENLVRFLIGGEYAPESSKSTQDQWSEKQRASKVVITGLLPAQIPEKKRARDDELTDDSQQPKKQRLSGPTTATMSNGTSTPLDAGPPLYTLHAISTSSPVRKKVDITIHQNAILMLNPSSRAAEATIPLSSLRRAFIVPTRGKQKPHWTVILLSSDVPDKAKPAPGAASTTSNPSETQQVIFGVDATTASATSFSSSTYTTTGEPSTSVLPKSSPTLPVLLQFLSNLSIPLVQPDTSVFKSACPGIGNSSSNSGIPGVEAHRGVKSGNLWFSSEGILWGESKPCEFWAVKDLYGKVDGVRITGSGRTCSVTLARRRPGDVDEQEEEDEVDETEFSMIDGKEREGISDWVRKHRHLFWQPRTLSPNAGVDITEGVAPAKPKAKNTGPITIRTMDEGSDSEDDDFSVSVSDLDGSERSSGSGSESSDDDEGEEGGDGSGEDEDEGASDDGEGEAEEEEEELVPAHHPLLRPGAMPRMSKAALEMAVGIVEDAFVGGGQQGEEGEEDEDEEDELDD